MRERERERGEFRVLLAREIKVDELFRFSRNGNFDTSELRSLEGDGGETVILKLGIEHWNEFG